MTQLEDRLRAALLDTATPPTETVDPLLDLERRVGRARMRWASAGVAAMVVLIAAIVVPLTVVGRSGSHRSSFTTPAPRVVSGASYQTMTVGGDSVWALSASTDAASVQVERLDPATGQLQARFAVPSYMHSIAYVGGWVWVWGPNGRSTRLEAVNPATGKSYYRELGATGPAPTGVGRGQPWAAVGKELVTLQIDGRRAAAWYVDSGGIEYRDLGRGPKVHSLLTSGGDVLESTNTITINELSGSVISSDTNTSGPPRPMYSGVPLAVGVGGVWTAEGSPLAQQTGNGGQIGSEILPPRGAGADAEPYSVVADSAGGIYVGWSRSAESADQTSYLTYYSLKALTADHPAPTAVVPNAGARDLSADSAGGVVYLKAASEDANAAVTFWNPTVRPTPAKPAPVQPVLWSGRRVISETLSADGSVWTLSTNGKPHPTYYVERHEPAAGEVVAKYTVPGWARYVYAAAGQIWVWGGGFGAYPDGEVEAIDQQTGAQVSRDVGKSVIMADVYSGHPVTAVGGGLFAILGVRRSVAELSVSGGQISVADQVAVPGVTQLFADGQLVYASSATRWLKTIKLTPVSRRTSLSGPPLGIYPNAPAHLQGLLVNQHSNVVGEQDDSDYFSSGLKAPASNGAATVPVFAALDPAGGLYVGWAADPDHAAQVVTYYTAKNLSTPVIVKHDPSYSTATFQSPGPPNATITAAEMSDFALDPAGGLVYLLVDPANPAGYSTVARWNPAR